MTESSYASGSTATPPRLLDEDLDLGTTDLDGFGSMFDNFGKRKSQIGVVQEGQGIARTQSPVCFELIATTLISNPFQETLSPAAPKVPSKSYFPERSGITSTPVRTEAPRLESSPYSMGGRRSQDALNQSNMITTAEATSRNVEGPPVPRHGQGTASANSSSVRPRPQKANSGAVAGLRRSAALSSRRESSIWQDEDAKLVMDSVSANRKSANLSNTLGSYRDQDGERNSDRSAYIHGQSNKMDSLYTNTFQGKQRSTVTPVNGSDQDSQISAVRLESSDSTPRAKQRDLLQPTEPSLFDSFLPVPATQYDSHHHKSDSNSTRPDGQPKKVMTRAQFERYRKEQENSEKASTSDASDDENDNYDDDDEAERNRQVAKQRRKQEAHLAVYRQQMKKVTGEQPSELPNIGQLRSGPEKAMTGTPERTSTSTPTFSFDKAPGNSKGSDDEDEDVPLGILAAHGFPTKNRPPTILGTAGANPYIRYTSESYPAPPMSTAGGSVAGGGKPLPPFARNLPQDPYYGASLVNASNRESLAFGTGGGSVYGGYSPNPNPGGLVGVIAGEERARALRRGSPNAQGNYAAPLPQGMPQTQMGMQPGMWPMQTMPNVNDPQSQMIAQMMQMNMQLMQSVQHLAGGTAQVPQPVPLSFGPSPQQQMMNGFLSPHGQTSRPTSTDSYSASGSAGLGVGQQGQQRAMSMMGSINGSLWPSKGNQRMTMMSGSFVGNQGYAPSIAPSERSNVGMPSRYRPVSIAPADEVPRSSMRDSSFMSGPSHLDSKDRRGSLMTTSIRPIQKSPSPPKLSAVSDDDDDEGWEQMKQKREKKKSSWKSKKKDEPNIDFVQFSET